MQGVGGCSHARIEARVNLPVGNYYSDIFAIREELTAVKNLLCSAQSAVGRSCLGSKDLSGLVNDKHSASSSIGLLL